MTIWLVTNNRGQARLHLFRKQKGRCWLCGGRMRLRCVPTHPEFGTFDHVIPRKVGGPNALWNLALAHRSCNTAREHLYPETLPGIAKAA